MSTLSDVGGAGLGAVASLGNFLDLPGSSVRDLLAGENPFDQWMSPLSDTNRTTGRQLLEKYGMRANRETGIGGWMNDPGEGLRDTAGFFAEVFLDPFGPLTAGKKMASITGSLLERAHPVVKGAAKGVNTAFNTLPEKITSAVLSPVRRAAGVARSLFDAPSGGVTDAFAQGVKRQAFDDITKVREAANLLAIEQVLIAQRTGFRLDADDTLDMTDPQKWFAERSPRMVNARENTIRKYLEGLYDPTNRGMTPGSFVTLGDDVAPREVEFLDRTATGTKVKLVNDDKLYADHELKLHWTEDDIELPPELMAGLDRYKTQINALQGRAQDLGLNLSELIDPYAEFAHRRKSHELSRAEQITGQAPPAWRRQKWQSLASALSAPGGRDMMYRAFTRGTVGVNELFADPRWNSVIKEIDGLAAPTQQLIDGLWSKVMPDYVGLKHVEDISGAMGLTPEELWTEVMRGRPVNATGTVAYAVGEGQYDVVRGGQRIGGITARTTDDGVELSHMLDENDPNFVATLQDAIHFTEYDLARKGVKKVSITGRPELGDSLKNFGYTGRQIAESGVDRRQVSVNQVFQDAADEFSDMKPANVQWWKEEIQKKGIDNIEPPRIGLTKQGKMTVINGRHRLAAARELGYDTIPANSDVAIKEKWSRNIYDAEEAVDNKPRFLTKTEFKNRIQQIIDWKANEVKQGDVPGVQPGRGWWKTWSELRTPDGKEQVFNMSPEKSNFVQITKDNIDMVRNINGFPSIVEYDLAKQAVEAGKDVWVGRRTARGKPAEFTMVTPTMRASIELQAKKLFDGLDKTLTDRPLTAQEAIYDTLHRDITRNYSDKVDQWMPELGDRGVVTAADANQVVHKATVNQWHKMLSEAMSADPEKALSADARKLARLDDRSLKALMFRPEEIEHIAKMREAFNAKIAVDKTMPELTQDVTIGVVDRHRGLAEELGDEITKRYNQIFEKSAIASQHDYMFRNGSAVAVLEAQRQFFKKAIVAQASNPDALGATQLGGNIEVDYDLKNAKGITFNDVLEKGFLGTNVNADKFLGSLHSELVSEGFFKESADELPAQMNRIKSLRLTSETWDQLKTFNDATSMFDLPELSGPMKFAQYMMTVEKAGLLSVSPATPMRDGMSSYFNAVILGEMNPGAALKYGNSALSFARGMPVDPGEGIKEIEEYLVSRGLESNMKNRGEAFQNFWNAHHMSGSIHPNVVTADAMRMAETDTSMSILNNAVGTAPAAGLEGLRRTVMKPWKAFDPRVAGTWTRDELGRSVQRSKGENPLVETVNGLRGGIDSVVRATYVLDRLAKTKSLADAFAMSDKVLLNADPRNFTRFEHQFMKSVFPFYSFMRQSIPLFMSEFLVNPGGKLGMTVRATRQGQGGSDEYVPYQYLDTAAIPIGETDEGNLRYLTSLGMMHEDAVKYAGNALQRDHRALLQHALASSNPAIKWLIEHSTNTSLFSQGPMGGRRLDDLDPNIGRIMTNLGLQDPDASGRARPVGGPLVESLAAAGPLSRALSMAKIATSPPDRASTLEKVFRLTTGIRPETVTQEQITRDLRDRINAEQIKLGARPLTTVVGSDKLMEYALAQGDTETATKLEKYERALSAQRKRVRDSEKKTEAKGQSLVDRLRSLR